MIACYNCYADSMKIVFADSEHQVNAAFKKQYSDNLKAAYLDAIILLPFASKHITFIVYPRTWSLMDTGDSAHTHNSELIELAFDPTFTKASKQVILDDVRYSVFHEMNHAARYNIEGIWHTTFLDSCIMEGLATAFTREHAGEKAAWADYPDDVTDWIDEIIAKNDAFPWPAYSYDHPDGRKWIAYKVGTYIVDEALKKSDKTVIELTQMQCADILQLAAIDTNNYRGLVA